MLFLYGSYFVISDLGILNFLLKSNEIMIRLTKIFLCIYKHGFEKKIVAVKLILKCLNFFKIFQCLQR